MAPKKKMEAVTGMKSLHSFFAPKTKAEAAPPVAPPATEDTPAQLAPATAHPAKSPPPADTNGNEEFVMIPKKGSGAKKASAKAAKEKKAAKHNAGKASKKRKASNVIDSESEGDEADQPSGSEYELSEDEDSDEDLDLSASEEDDDLDSEEDLSDDDGGPSIPRKKKTGAAAAAKPKPTPKPRPSSATAGKALIQRTPGVAVSNGVSITPNTGGRATPAAAGVLSALPARTPGSAAVLNSALSKGQSTPGSVGPDAGEGGNGDASRFAARDTARFPFLQPEKIRDANKRRPDEAGYDPRTLYIPPDWFKVQKISEGQRQWWDFKVSNFDAVLLFKMGKFYEMFEMDAHVGADVLGLSYMKGDQPHCGFPEAAYHQMAETLARAGLKVVVIEQTETPDMLAIRNEERKKQGLKKAGVVRREKVAMLTKGTMCDAEMLSAAPDAQHLVSLVEFPAPQDSNTNMEEGKDLPNNNTEPEAREKPVRKEVVMGACAVDVATGRVLVGQWRDDEGRSRLRAALTALQPVEVVIPLGGLLLSGTSRRIMQGVLRRPRMNEVPVGSEPGQFWEADATWEALTTGEYFTEAKGKLPAVLEAMHAAPAEHVAAATALGGCLSFLKDALLDKRVLSAGNVEWLGAAYGVGEGALEGFIAGTGAGTEPGVPMYLTLDGPALENLEVLENADGGVSGTLAAALDHCTTPAGRRLLRQWLCRPLCRVADITARQDAVADLIGPAEEAACQARRCFAGLADLERALARLGAAGSGAGSMRDDPRVVLYEDVGKKRVQALLAAVRGLERVKEAAAAFAGLELTSSLLKDLVTPGRAFPEMDAALDEMRAAADWDEAEATGRIVLALGVDPGYDAAQEAVRDADRALANYLKEAKAELGGAGASNANYVSINKESHVIEVAESVTVPRTWESVQGKKGFKRYTNSDLRELVADREAALEGKEKAQAGILQGLLRRFAARRAVWSAAVDCMAKLDVLMSLAVAAACGSGPMCRPTMIPWSAGPAVFKAKGLRHPAGVSGASGTFVPNDVTLGGDSAPFVVLTGPNMGGKSTLMRQVCLAALAAQIGAWVPADALDMSPVDAVFVRMGARDRIMLGQSTFMVELSETAAALNRGTEWSLVALDELGRGTATLDGAAIASAVLDHLASSVRCRGVFATHYHHISDAHASDPAVAIKHMACAVTPPADADGVEEVTFLYTLSEGACPKSYGVNVARLAGLPDDVVKRAAVVSEQTEAAGGGNKSNGASATAGAVAVPMDVDVSAPNKASDEELFELAMRVVKACKVEGTGDGKVAVVQVWNNARQILRL